MNLNFLVLQSHCTLNCKNRSQTTSFSLFQTRRVRFNLPDTDGDIILDVEKLQNNETTIDAGVREINKSKITAGESLLRTHGHQHQFSHSRRDNRYTREVESSTRRSDPEGTTKGTTPGGFKSSRRRGCNFGEHM